MKRKLNELIKELKTYSTDLWLMEKQAPLRIIEEKLRELRLEIGFLREALEEIKKEGRR